MKYTESSNGCAAMAVLSVAIVLLIGIFLFLTQKAYIVNYLGEESNGRIIYIDSVHGGYNKYEFKYFIKQSSGKIVKITEGNFTKKTHQLGQEVKIKTYRNQSEFKTQSPNLYLLIPLICIFSLFVRMYFVFR